jgi:hypothetical protein
MAGFELPFGRPTGWIKTIGEACDRKEPSLAFKAAGSNRGQDSDFVHFS